MPILKKQITYKNKQYEVRWEEGYNDYAYGYGDKIIELVLYEVIEKELLGFKRKDYKEVCKIDVTNVYCGYIEQINTLFKAYEIILCKEREKAQRLEELEQWDGIIE